MLPETLDIKSATLRLMRRDDLEPLSEQLAKYDIAQWMAAIAHPFTPEDAAKFLEFGQDPGNNVRVIEIDGVVAGCLSLGHGIWFWIDTHFSRQGIMQQILKAAIGATFAANAPPLLATCRTDNLASMAVLTKLGFSQRPRTSNMFFRSFERGLKCFHYVLTPEQWYFINPPTLQIGEDICLRPATMRDANFLAELAPKNSGEIWPNAGAVCDFIETHRCRALRSGLFIVEADPRIPVGAALVSSAKGKPRYLFRDNNKALHLVPLIDHAFNRVL